MNTDKHGFTEGKDTNSRINTNFYSRKPRERRAKNMEESCRTQTITESISPQSSMREVLEVYPGAQRALFRQYHIGGCSSCAFQPEETLGQVCQRNGGLDVNEVLQHIKTSHEQDA